MTSAFELPGSESKLRLRRALLRMGQPDAMLQDHVDCAELILASGAHDLATSFYGLVTLEAGFSARTLAMLENVDTRAGLWGNLPKPGPMQIGGLSIDIALGELRRLMRFRPKLQAVPPSLNVFLPTEQPMGVQLRREIDPAQRALAQRIAVELRGVPLTARNGGLAPLLAGSADALLALSPIYVDHYADADIETLALMAVLEGTRRFLLANADLLAVRPAELFNEVAALDPGALGPFFSNAGMLLRGTSDLFALIDVAAGGRADPATLECWTVLLSAYLPEDRLASLTAEMGDRGMATGLRRILTRIARAGGDRRPLTVVQSIRDASLDIDALSVAGDAQELIALWQRVDAGQWRRLGEIRGYVGDLRAAKAALERAVELNSRDDDAKAQLALINAGEMIPFEEEWLGRRRLRRARLAAFQAAN